MSGWFTDSLIDGVNVGLSMLPLNAHVAPGRPTFGISCHLHDRQRIIQPVFVSITLLMKVCMLDGKIFTVLPGRILVQEYLLSEHRSLFFNLEDKWEQLA